MNQSELTEKEQAILASYGLTEAAKPKFFVRRPGTLFVVSLVTAGLYDVYWMYQNWAAVRDASGKKLSPFWRTIFAIFYTYPLFKLMALTAKRNGYDRDYSAGLLAIGYLFVPYITVAGSGGRVVGVTTPLMYGAQLLAAMVSIYFLVTAQQAAIFANSKGRSEPKFAPFSVFEIGIVVLGVVATIAVSR